MTLNVHEFGAIEELAHSFGAKFRLDPLITPRLDGGRQPLALRLEAAEAVRLEFADAERRQGWQEVYAKQHDAPPSSRLFQCGAGQIGFHVDAFGNLQPCMMLRGFSYSLQTGSFSRGWAELARMREMQASPNNRCVNCRLRVYCGYCPGLMELECGDPEVPSAYLCALGAERLRAISEAHTRRSADAIDED